MPEPTLNDIVAKRLGISAHEVAIAIDRWEGDQIMHAVLQQRIVNSTRLLQTNLESCSEADLKTIQGQINGLKTARALIIARP